MDSRALVWLSSSLITTNHQQGVRYPKTSLLRNNLCKRRTTEEVLRRHDSPVIPAGTSTDSNSSSLPLCDLRQVLGAPRRKTEIMGLSYFSRHLSDTSEILGLETQRRRTPIVQPGRTGML